MHMMVAVFILSGKKSSQKVQGLPLKDSEAQGW